MHEKASQNANKKGGRGAIESRKKDKDLRKLEKDLQHVKKN